ncbi:Porphobilinogen deaminase [Actinomyces bovis]|uniref:Hydroxymethylbilane synthase n=1 Tax=Actinomyces bovis TaxID=1658 RepID=A0ABY1VQV7_9ACTO|nr:hydroxymethylbilane synthase [Actinomyces bovis]SPT54309.1 Porphobilinogen deaminase [Actinomyces bovis]VEG56335.1 Porphobilinogen deaminase [Actinomyces israelii]
MSNSKVVRLGTRASALATTQSNTVAQALEVAAASAGVPLDVELVEVRTRGDVDPTSLARLGGVGVFAAALRESLLAGACDLAVHSCKDLPTAPAPGLTVAAVPQREDPRDALCLSPELVARGVPGLEALPLGARVGTGSPRRAAQLLALRPDLELVDLRGNVPTRLSRVVGSVVSADGPMGASREPDLDAVVLALAGLRRLGLEAYATLVLAATPEQAEATGAPLMLPAPAQGALAVECRAEVAEQMPSLATALAVLDDPVTRAAVTAERALLAGLQAGCAAPVGALARMVDGALRLDAVVVSPEGARQVSVREFGEPAAAKALGLRAAESLLAQGAGQIADLRAIKSPAAGPREPA